MSISGAHLVQHVIYDLTVLVLRTEQDDLGIFADYYRVPGRPVEQVRLSHPNYEKMSYGPKSGVLFIARIETIVTAIQNNDLIVSAPMVRLSNAPPPMT